MNGDDTSFLDWGSLTGTDPGAFGQSGYGVLQSSADQPVPYTDFSGANPGSIGQGFTPDQYAAIDQAIASDPSVAGSGLSAGGILKSLANLGAGLGPAFKAAGQIAAGALNQRPQLPGYAGAFHSSGGTAQPLSLSGSVVAKPSPLASYVQLMQGLR